MDKIDITIIGAGVVGLAIAAELSKKFPRKDIVVLEKHDSFGQETSSRNSEVVHSGIYYTPGSLKAKLCVLGKKMIRDICEKNHILFRELGKIIIASNDDEVKQLDELLERGRRNGVEDIELIGPAKIKQLEPNVSALAALCSPATGVIDSHNLMKYFFQAAKDNGVLFSFSSELTGCERVNNGYILKLDEDSFESKIVINSAGLWADKVAAMVGVNIRKSGYELNYLKGEYFSCRKHGLVKGLVYPTPQRGNKALGIHTLVGPDGSIRFGPNSFYVNEIDYKVDPEHKNEFLKSIQTYLPAVKLEDLSPDQAGIRPKLAPPLAGQNDLEPDFIIKEESEKGYPGFINLIGIESPGLTSAPAIADAVLDLF